jgi:hypothetical protein
MDKRVEEIRKLLSSCTTNQREIIFRELRKEFNIHPLEAKLATQAEIILEAINKDDKGLTFRMLRGVIAEAAFQIEIISKMKDWSDVTPMGDLPYDYLLRDSKGDVSVQVKLQRSKEFKPMYANEALKKFSSKQFVVETQKTRGGIDAETKEDTRPYKFGEFDILAVSTQPSTNAWSTFMYTVANWLLPMENDDSRILKFQPVSPVSNDDWTDNFATCIEWLRSGKKKRITFKE